MIDEKQLTKCLLNLERQVEKIKEDIEYIFKCWPENWEDRLVNLEEYNKIIVSKLKKIEADSKKKKGYI